MHIIYDILGSVLIFIILPGTIELLFLTLSGMVPLRLIQPSSNSTPLQLCVVVPAHNEEISIGSCIASLLNRTPGHHQASIVVIADNCNDSTIRIAKAAGVNVIERHDDRSRGKGYALNHAFNILLQESYDAFLIVDADTVVEPNFVNRMGDMFEKGSDAVQCRNLVKNVDESIHTRLMGIAWVAFNILRLRGRERWGISVGILGNGFGLSRATLVKVPFNTFSIAEDLEYHLRLVKAGLRVRYCQETTVWSDTPVRGQAAAGQIARWEGGRFRAIREQAPELIFEVLKGRLRLLEPLMDLLLLPLAFHVFLLLCLLALPFPVGRILALVGLGCVILHICAAIYIERGGWREVTVLFYAPFYMLWKLLHGHHIIKFSNRSASWRRTDRTKRG